MNERGILGKLDFETWKLGFSDIIITAITILAVILFASYIVNYFFSLQHVPLSWKLSILTFILVLPVSFFVQTLLHIDYIRRRKKQNLLKQMIKIYKNVDLSSGSQFDLDNKVKELKKEYSITTKKLGVIDNDFKDLQLAIASVNADQSRRLTEEFKQMLERKAFSGEHVDKNNKYTEQDNIIIHDRFAKIDYIRKGYEEVIVFYEELYRKYNEIIYLTKKYLQEKNEKMSISYKQLENLYYKRIYSNVDLEKPSAVKESIENLEDIIELIRSQKKRIRNLDRIIKYLMQLAELDLDETALDQIVKYEMISERETFSSYITTMSFYLFIYFSGFLLSLPLIQTISNYHQLANLDSMTIASMIEFIMHGNTFILPISGTVGIPLIVSQWGFFGGFIYSSITLLTRFFRKDLSPRAYYNAGFRLLLAIVVPILIYLIYLQAGGLNGFANLAALPTEEVTSLNMTEKISIHELKKHFIVPPYILLVCFTLGAIPIQFLKYIADNFIVKVYRNWKSLNSAGNHSVSQLEGVDITSSQRINEEGISTVQEIALCNPSELSTQLNFLETIVRDWKDQAILYLMTGDIFFKVRDLDNKEKTESLSEILLKKLGIRRISELNIILDTFYKNNSCNNDEEKKKFFKALGLLADNDKNIEHLCYMFLNVYQTGQKWIKN